MMTPRLVLSLAIALAAAGSLVACANPLDPTCLATGTIVGGQARLPVALAQAGAQAPYSREVAVAGGDVFLADAAGRALPGLTVRTSDTGAYQVPRIPAGHSFMVAVRAKTASGAPVVLKTLARTGTQGAAAEVNVATTIATTALLEGQREAIGDFDQASYDKLVAQVYRKLEGVTALDLNDEAAVIALFKGWAAQDAELRALYDRLRAEVTNPRIPLAEQIDAIAKAQGAPTGGGLPTRPPLAGASPQAGGATSAPSPSASPDATTAPGPGAETPAPSASPSASGTPSASPSVLAGDVTTIAGQEAGFADGVGIQARFNGPGGLAFDPAAATPVLYVADTVNNRIRRVDLADPDHAVVTTVAGTGASGSRDGDGDQAHFDRPSGLAFAPDGTLLVADGAGKALRRVEVRQAPYRVTTVVGGADGPFVAPAGLAVDPVSGAIYVTDRGDGAVRRVVTNATPPIVSALVAPAGPDASQPAGVVVDPNGYLWVADMSADLIRTVAADGTVATFAGRGSGYAEGQGTDAVFRRPTGIARHPDGYLVVADAGNHRIRSLDADGRTALLAGGGAAGRSDGRVTAASFDTPSWVAIAPDGTIYVADTGNHRIRRIE
jgi:sugar lactone lactonase YvrE